MIDLSTAQAGAAAAAFGPTNPVRVDLNGHPANSGFLVFVEGDVGLNADEAAGTIALGGDLSFGTSYNLGAGKQPKFDTFTAPGDALSTFLYVGGGISWQGTNVLKVLNDGFAKVGDPSTYTASNEDSNNAIGNYHITPAGQPYESTPRIEGTTNLQDGASIGGPGRRPPDADPAGPAPALTPPVRSAGGRPG